MSKHLVIEVQSADLTTRQGTKSDPNTGRETPWKVVTQKVYFHVGEAYPVGYDISIDWERNQAPYAPGQYLLGGKSIRSGKYGPEFNRYLELIPVPQPQKAN